MIEATYIRKAKSWSEFSISLNSLIENNKKLQAGKIYEKCVQLFLQTDPKYQAILKNVWLLQDVPKAVREKLKLPNADEGIDLIAETNQKSYWAIQAKYKSEKSSTLTRKDLATFRDLAFNYCNNIQHGLVCSPISHEPKKSHLMNDMGFALINEWEDLDKDKNKGWKNVQKKLGGKAVKPEKFKPKPHQLKAIKEVIKAFKSNSVERGKMIMPCGTGKSLTAFWITRDMKVKNVLVAIPSLSLLQQTLNVWTKEFLANDIQPDYLCVCSDESAGSLEKDEFTAQTYDLGIPTTTDVDEISTFLKDKNSKFKIIFTTYQSGQATAKASKKAKFTFDLGIMDEAHKTVGHKFKPMAHLLYEKNIKIKKRLFMTATERVYKGGKENEILSMDDPQDYGNTVYQMTYKEAIDAGVVSDYKIVSFNVTDAEYREIIQNNEYIRLNNNPKQNDDVTARELATALALRKTFKKLKISKALSFHSSIRRADKFEELNKQISNDFKKYPSIETYHVSSKQKSSDRAQEMRSFEQSNKSLMTNARCLTEGVDVPAIDCVAFIDSKRSKVDIVQAAGRAMRVSKGKKYGYILVPVITNSGNINSASIDTEYEDLISVISSLATQDERLIDEIKSISKKAISKKSKTSIINNNLISLKRINLKNIDQKISLKVWNRISRIGFCNYEEAKKYALKLKLSNVHDWIDFASSSKKPIDIPFDPSRYYVKRGWENWGKFLGTNRIAHQYREYMSYEESKRIIKKLKFKSANDYKLNFVQKVLKLNIPYKPDEHFKNKGWKNWGDFLGESSKYVKKEKIINYDNAKKIVRKNKIKSSTEYHSIYRKKLEKLGLPLRPERHYKNFEGWSEFLDYKLFDYNYISYKKLKKLIVDNNINTPKKYYNFYNLNRLKLSIPKNPNKVKAYENNWKSWNDLFDIDPNKLGNNPELRKSVHFKNRNYLSFKEARNTIIRINKGRYGSFRKMIKDGLVPINIPLTPNKYYSEFLDWGDFLTGKTNRKMSFEEAKTLAKKNDVKSGNDWKKLSKKYSNLPWDPEKYYKSEWKSWGEFLDIKNYNPAIKTYFVSYKEAKKILAKNKIKRFKDFKDKINKLKNLNIPLKPKDAYTKRNEWISWDDFFGKK